MKSVNKILYLGTVRSISNESKVAPLRKLCPTAKYPVELVEADLLKEEGWEDALKGCEYVMHVASPVPVCIFLTDSMC